VPSSEIPPGSCTGTCQNYPRKTNIAVPNSTTVKTIVVVPFAELLPAAAATANEMVGMVWQVTPAACTVDMRIYDVRFVVSP
jgi:hypothetical protein